MANDFMDVFVLLLVGGLLLPIALNQWFSANTDAWDSSAQLVWPFVAILGLVSLAIGSIQGIRKATGKR